MKNPRLFKRQLLASSISACTLALAATTASAQTQNDDMSMLEEVVVVGIRSAQETALNVKRDATSIVDAISAEDIGKLPDVTIADSLQRITGVQVRRSAGEGAAINVRGMPQVLTMLNGESYLGANSLTTVQPNFTDIPSQLFSGAEVVKSQTATQHSGGITGVVDLKTYRPFSFDQGLTVSGAVQASQGVDSGETDPSMNGLINWQNDRIGFLAAVSHQSANLANYYSGMAGGGSSAGWTGFAGEDWSYGWVTPDASLGDLGGQVVDGGVDANQDGDLGDAYWAYQGHVAYNRFEERERNGINLAFQADLGNGFELVTEAFYTDMEGFDRIMGMAHSDKWQRWGWFDPTQYTAKDAIANERDLHTVQEYTGNGRRFKSYASVAANEANSTNVNVELNYDNGGAFTGSARLISGSAEQSQLNSYMDIDVADGSQWGVDCQHYPAGTEGTQGDCGPGQLKTNPNGYQGYPVLSVNYAGSDPVWSGFDNNANTDLQGEPIAGAPDRSLASYLESVDNYSLGAFSSENNYDREGDLNVARFDGNYAFDEGFLTSVDFGIRHSAREVKNSEFDLLSPMGPDNCGVKWKATDVDLNGGGIEGACTWTDGDGNAYTAGIPTPLSELNPTQITDFGSVSGLPAIWTADPASMDDVESYHNRLYPGTARATNPGRSYEVELDELSYFVQANFATGIMSGNFGLRQVNTDLTVLRNEVGAARPYGAAAQDDGDITTKREMDELLPSLNLRFDLTDEWVLRAAVSRTMAPLDLAQWGGGLSPSYAIDSEEGSPTEGQFIVIGASADGNPDLEMWNATNFDLSAEYYLGSASALTAGWFYVEVDSFIESGTVEMALPDQDGVVRRTVDVSTSVQGDGGVLKGTELAAKLAFGDFTDGALRDFGTDINYTYSPSNSGNTGLNGETLPFQDNSEHVFNLVGWYEAGPWQARIAYNYRSKRVVAFNQTWGEGTLWQEPTAYVDASFSYDINDVASVFFNASNITNEQEEYYLEWEDQFAWQNEYEARYTVGVRATF
ncbi:TonB-dependent receptor [Marinimicrobium agarilyticum]|uniref:TonB-dependent receptor n=1 Tax=Marinimicrobium agarilyticum TaxID=306546 RepID=UPI0004071A37|nr:TonB-dependent receptor [Marinimicrobium agarilyticum]